MSKITLEPNSSGAGTFSIVSPDSNINRTLNLPDASGNIIAADSSTGRFDSSNMPAGSVIQVITFVTSTELRIAADDTYVDSGVEASITPSNASNKILVITNQKGNTLGAVDFVTARILANGTQVYSSRQQIKANLGSNDHRGIDYSLVYLDSPNTTSQVTYKVQVEKTDGNRIDIQKNDNNGSITLMEIAG